MRKTIGVVIFLSIGFLVGPASAEEFFLLTGVNAGLNPAVPRAVVPIGSSGMPSGYAPGMFNDGDRLAGNMPSGTALSWQGLGTPLFSPNQFGALSFSFRRGSVFIGTQHLPLMGIEFLGGPKLDLDGDLGNSTRSLIPIAGQSAVLIPGSSSSINLSFNLDLTAPITTTLHRIDVTGTNEGATNLPAEFGVTVNTLAGTASSFSGFDAPLNPIAINPTIDDRTGSLKVHGSLPGVFEITGLGGEMWQDSISSSSSGAGSLGTTQFIGENIRGWLITRTSDASPWPTLAGSLGGTVWADVAGAGDVVSEAHGLGGGPSSSVTIADGFYGPPPIYVGDVFTGDGLPTTDLGLYLDSVVVPNLFGDATRFVYLESSGVGVNNSADPVFGDTVGYGTVIIAQNVIPEPGSVSMLLVIMGLALRRRVINQS